MGRRPDSRQIQPRVPAAAAEHPERDGRAGENAEREIRVSEAFTAIFAKSIRRLFIFKCFRTSTWYLIAFLCFTIRRNERARGAAECAARSLRCKSFLSRL